MSFTQKTLSKSSTGYAHKISGQGWNYTSTTDDLDTIKADGYFDGAATLFSLGEVFTVLDSTFEGDLLEIFEINPTAPKIKTRGFVSAGSIPDGSITTPKLANLAVTTAKIDDLAVTTVKIDLNAVTTNKLAAFSVTTGKIDSEAVTNVQLADNAVRTAKIFDANVTKPKLSAGLDYGFKIVNVLQIGTVGGSTTELFNFPGVTTAATEFILVNMRVGPAVPVQILKAQISAANTVQVVFSADPGILHFPVFVHLKIAT